MRKTIAISVALICCLLHHSDANGQVSINDGGGGTRIIYRSAEVGFFKGMQALARSETHGRWSDQELTEHLTEQFKPLFVQENTLRSVVADVLQRKTEDIEIVPYDQWAVRATAMSASGKKDDDRFSIAINPEYIGERTRSFFDFRGNFSYEINIAPHSNGNQSKAIIEQYNKKMALDVKKISEKLFTEKFERVFAEAQKEKDEIDKSISDLEARLKDLQAQSYDFLPYEKAVDQSADLQRQRLAIELSLAGMKAREQAIHEQIDMARLRLKEQADRSAKETASDEMIGTLKQLVALREKNVEHLKAANKSGVAVSSEVDDAEAKASRQKFNCLL